MMEDVIRACLENEEWNTDVEVSVTFVDNEEIKDINSEYRQKDAVTDVLSFPILHFKNGYTQTADGEFRKEIDEDTHEGYDYDGENLLIGDIVLSLERANQQSQEYGHGYEREVAFLICHSMFHLLGYDHIVPEDEVIMKAKQEKVLQALGYTR